MYLLRCSFLVRLLNLEYLKLFSRIWPQFQKKTFFVENIIEALFVANFKIWKPSLNSILLKFAILSFSSTVIRQKGKSQNGCFKKTKHAKFSGKQTFLTPWYAKKCSFFGKFVVLCFLETSVLRFALLPYYRRVLQFTNFPPLYEEVLLNCFYRFSRKLFRRILLTDCCSNITSIYV